MFATLPSGGLTQLAFQKRNSLLDPMQLAARQFHSNGRRIDEEL